MRLKNLSGKCRAILEKYMKDNGVSYIWDAISQIVEDWGKDLYAKEMQKECKYPCCYHYKEDAKHYCCNACAGDHYDYERLRKREKSI